jgi:hypothetical protein
MSNTTTDTASTHHNHHQPPRHVMTKITHTWTGRHVTNNVASNDDETNISFVFLVSLTEPQLRDIFIIFL